MVLAKRVEELAEQVKEWAIWKLNPRDLRNVDLITCNSKMAGIPIDLTSGKSYIIYSHKGPVRF